MLKLDDVMQVKTEDIRTTDQGALMHVLATTAEVLVVVCGHGPASEKAALEHITAVDPPSAKVELKEVLTTASWTARPSASNLFWCTLCPQISRMIFLKARMPGMCSTEVSWEHIGSSIADFLILVC